MHGNGRREGRLGKAERREWRVECERLCDNYVYGNRERREGLEQANRRGGTGWLLATAECVRD